MRIEGPCEGPMCQRTHIASIGNNDLSKEVGSCRQDRRLQRDGHEGRKRHDLTRQTGRHTSRSTKGSELWCPYTASMRARINLKVETNGELEEVCWMHGIAAKPTSRQIRERALRIGLALSVPRGAFRALANMSISHPDPNSRLLQTAMLSRPHVYYHNLYCKSTRWRTR